MKVLMVMQHINFFRNLDTVVRELDARGHETVMLHGTRLDDPKAKAKFERKKQKMVFMGRGIEVAEEEIPTLSTGYRPEPTESWQRRLQLGRQLVSRGIYYRKGHPSPERVTEGLEKRLPDRVRARLDSRLVQLVLRSRLSLWLWRRFEALVPASPTVVELVREIAPDVMLVSPTIWPKSPVEADYVRAARKLGIPTIGYVNSWDNLTSKGTVHLLPTRFVVWNEPMADEARSIHSIPNRIIRVTGAPHLDHFFSLRPRLSGAELHRWMGCPEDRPYVVYLCSSRTLIENENHIVSELADALAGRFGAGAPTLLVRPHPVSPDTWEGYQREGVAVFPKLGDQADTPAAWQEYYDQLAGAAGFFGLNTTAFLEASVADRPCITVVADEYYAVQGRTGHFRHLLAADFLEVCANMDEAADRIAGILDGEDLKAEQRRRFALDFMRPCGADIPARTIVADLIEEVAGKRETAAAPKQARHAPQELSAKDAA